MMIEGKLNDYSFYLAVLGSSSIMWMQSLYVDLFFYGVYLISLA